MIMDSDIIDKSISMTHTIWSTKLNSESFFRNIAGDLAISEAEINFEKYFFVTSFYDCNNGDVSSTEDNEVLDQLISNIFIRSRDNRLNPSCVTEETLQFEFVDMENGQIKSLGRFFHGPIRYRHRGDQSEIELKISIEKRS